MTVYDEIRQLRTYLAIPETAWTARLESLYHCRHESALADDQAHDLARRLRQARDARVVKAKARSEAARAATEAKLRADAEVAARSSGPPEGGFQAWRSRDT